MSRYGRNGNKGTAERKGGKCTNGRNEGQNRGRLGQTRKVGKNEVSGWTQEVDKMNTATNSQEEKK